MCKFRQQNLNFAQQPMSPDFIFQLCSGLAFIGWLLLLIVSPYVMEIDKFLIGVIITVLALVYAWLIFSSFHPGDMKNFGSLDGVMQLFQSKVLVTAGWVHYLAFDLLTGIWIKRNAVKHNIPHGWTIPCLLLTFMLGPVGLLLFLAIRFVKTKQYFSTSF
jgi:putative Mn2+ efflux pump MntP